MGFSPTNHTIYGFWALLGGRPKVHHRSRRPITSKKHIYPTKSTSKSGIPQVDASIEKIKNMIPKRAIHCQGLVQTISRCRLKKQIPRGLLKNMLAARAQNPGILHTQHVAFWRLGYLPRGFRFSTRRGLDERSRKRLWVGFSSRTFGPRAEWRAWAADVKSLAENPLRGTLAGAPREALPPN